MPIYNFPRNGLCRGLGSAEGEKVVRAQRSIPGEKALGARSHLEQAAFVFVTL